MILNNKSKLQDAVEAIIYAARDLDPVMFFDITLHTKNHNFSKMEYISIDVIKDFVGNDGEFYVVDVNMLLGDFVKTVLPSKNLLYMTVMQNSVGNLTTKKFIAKIAEMPKGLHNDSFNSIPHDDLNNTKKVRVTFHLFNETIEILRTKRAANVFKGTDPTSALIATLDTVLQKTTKCANIIKKSITMSLPDNTRKYDHVVLPSSGSIDSVLDLPNFLQNGDTGIFNGGISMFLDSDGEEETMHIFPPFKIDLKSSLKRKLRIFCVANELPNTVNGTYTVSSDLIKIIAPKPEMTEALGDIKHSEHGVGIEGIESDTIGRRSHQTYEDKVITKPDYVKRRLVHKELEDKLYKTKEIKPTNNWYKVRSNVMANDGRMVSIVWKKSNLHYLKPGMIVELFTEDSDGNIVKHLGRLHGLHGYSTRTDTITSTRASLDIETTILSVFLENESKGEVYG